MIAVKRCAPLLVALGLTTWASIAAAQTRPQPAAPAAPAGSGAPAASGAPVLPPSGASAGPAGAAAQSPADLEDDRAPVRPARAGRKLRDGADSGDAADSSDADADADAEAGAPKRRASAKAAEQDKRPMGPTYMMPAVDAPREEAAPVVRKEPPKPHIQHWSAGLGFLGAAVNSVGFDPYSKDNTLPMVALFGTVTPWATRPVSVHLAFEWDYGGSSATARGDASSIDIHRLSLGLEGRYEPISRMRLFLRAMPSAIHVAGDIQDSYLNNHLSSGSWTWGADVTGGAAARIGAVGHPDLPAVSFWLGLDMGYRFAGVTSMRFRPSGLTEDDQTRHFGEIALPNLDLSGFVGKLSLSIGF